MKDATWIALQTSSNIFRCIRAPVATESCSYKVGYTLRRDKMNSMRAPHPWHGSPLLSRWWVGRVFPPWLHPNAHNIIFNALVGSKLAMCCNYTGTCIKMYSIRWSVSVRIGEHRCGDRRFFPLFTTTCRTSLHLRLEDRVEFVSFYSPLDMNLNNNGIKRRNKLTTNTGASSMIHYHLLNHDSLGTWYNT